MKKLILIIIILSLIFTHTIVYGRVSTHSSSHAHTSHSSVHSTSTSKSSSAKTTIKGYISHAGKTYTTPKSFSSKYNSSNIKTGTVNSNPSHFTSYSTSNIFRPNFWTAMWAFNCMNNNTKEVTEQDISKELEERGYSQEEIKEILKEGEEAKQAEQNEQNKGILIVFIIIVTFAIIVLLIIYYIEHSNKR